MAKNWRERISQPRFGIRVEKNVTIPARDGVNLTADIYRPDASGSFPALLAMSPYGKEVQALSRTLPPQAASGPLWDGVIEAGDTDYLVSRGYVHVIADVRGTGYSGGEHVGIFTHKEGEDGYDIIEWIAKQPWCNGNVGLIGMSYFGGIQPRIAIQQPPHLKAIMPIAAWTDVYRHVLYHGGVLCLFWYGLWDGRGGDSGYAMNNVSSAMAKTLSKEEFARQRELVLSNPDIQKFSNLFHLLKYPQKNPLFVDALLNPCDGPFYRERSAVYQLSKIKAPVFAVGTWLRGWGAAGAISIYNGVNAPKKLLIDDPIGLWDRPWNSYHEEAIRWFDHWLKDNDTGFMDEPPIQLQVGWTTPYKSKFIRGTVDRRPSKEWPPAEAESRTFFLRSFGSLSGEPESYVNEPDSFVQQPIHIGYEIQSLQYVTATFATDFEVIGPASVHLFAAIDQDDTNWIVGLYDVGSGAQSLVSIGYLKASHRKLDGARSTPLQPYHTHDAAMPVTPGEINEYAIELSPIGYVFKAGHRLLLEVRSLEHSKEGAEGVQPPNTIHLCSSKTTLHKIYRDTNRRSRLLLSVVPKASTGVQ